MKILFDSKTISDRVALMAKQVNHDYKDKNLVVVGVLKGAFIFMADLVRHLTVPLTVDFLRVASYQGQKSSG
ncbi:MAG TPA: hypoxanthine phosphoribosyltransferase, partial [Deltaproteobacteria bacterium]|nr:hypoxanthine phosphoribosyltransferase [Deltaproteobacteria bacterium]